MSAFHAMHINSLPICPSDREQADTTPIIVMYNKQAYKVNANVLHKFVQMLFDFVLSPHYVHSNPMYLMAKRCVSVYLCIGQH